MKLIFMIYYLIVFYWIDPFITFKTLLIFAIVRDVLFRIISEIFLFIILKLIILLKEVFLFKDLPFLVPIF